MMNLNTAIYSHSHDLPDMKCDNFFHSKTLFILYENTPRLKPYMVVVRTADGHILSHILAIVRYRTSFFPPYIYMHCRVFGEGEYSTECGYSRDELFGSMLRLLTKKLQNKVLYIEFSNLCSKMFGYRQFKMSGFFPVHWMNIHNSLHSKTPEERAGKKIMKRIKNAQNKGVTVTEVSNEEDFYAFSRILHNHNRLKPLHYIPDNKFFKGIMETGQGHLFITRHKKRAIGCCACAYSENNAYLWYSASLRKSFAMLHPDTITIWHAIKHAHSNGCAHFFFMNVGLPFRKNPFREFILQFGGKPVSTYRWFRFSTKWINSIMSRIYRD